MQNIDNEKVKCRQSLLLTTDDKLAGMTYNIKYHLPCLVKCQRKSKPSRKVNNEQRLSDLEIVDWVSRTLNKGAVRLSMYDVQEMYYDILTDNSVIIDPCKRYKPY